MFCKNGSKLKKEARTLLLSTNRLYQDPIKEEEVKSIQSIWSRICGHRSLIMVSRFSKERLRFGFSISTDLTKRGFEHQVEDVVTTSDIGKFTQIEADDILLEANGVNLLQLNYSQLSIVFAYLPKNIQFVYLKKENAYEKLDVKEHNEKSSLESVASDGWMHPVNIMVQRFRKEPVGLQFTQISSFPLNRYVIKGIHLDGCCHRDKRLSVGDAIVKINNEDVQNYSEKDIRKFLHSNKHSVSIITIAKSKEIVSNPDLVDNITQKHIIETENKTQSQILNLHSAENKDPELADDLLTKKGYLQINLDKFDDLGIFLVDIEKFNAMRSIICGFHEYSKLENKLRIGDEIIKVNDVDVRSFSSLDIGKRLKKSHYKTGSTKIEISRNDPPFINNNGFVITSETSGSSHDLPPQEEIHLLDEEDSLSKDFHTFSTSISKVNNSFGLYIQNAAGPTITRVISDSELYKKEIIQPGDKIVRINDIYVFDKNRDFVLTLIRSCGQTMLLELLRTNGSSIKMEYINNSLYNLNEDIRSYQSKED